MVVVQEQILKSTVYPKFNLLLFKKKIKTPTLFLGAFTGTHGMDVRHLRFFTLNYLDKLYKKN